MAGLQEIYELLSVDSLRLRVIAACLVHARTIILEAASVPNHTARMAWSRVVLARDFSVDEITQIHRAIVVMHQNDHDTADDDAIKASVVTAVEKLVLD